MGCETFQVCLFVFSDRANGKSGKHSKKGGGDKEELVRKIERKTQQENEKHYNTVKLII